MKRFVFIIIFFITCLTVFANEKKIFSFTATPEYSLMNGNISEYVFNKYNNNTGNMESRLDWDVKNVSCIGFNASATIIKYIYIDVNGKIAISKKSGNMQDYDWLNSVYAIWENDDSTELTNYSIHDNTLNSYQNYQFSLGGKIYLPIKTVINPFIAYKHEYYNFTGSNGYCTYKSSDFEKSLFSGDVISYEQETNCFFMGINFFSTIIPYVDLFANIQISPSTNSFAALDKHFERSLCFYDKPTNVFILESKMKINYALNEHHSFGLNGDIQYIPLAKGKTYSSELTLDNKSSGKWNESYGYQGGVSRFIWSVGINYTFTF